MIYLLDFRISEGLIFLLTTPARKRSEPGVFRDKMYGRCGRVRNHKLAGDMENGQLAADTGSLPSASLRSVLTGFPKLLGLDGRFHDNWGMGRVAHTFGLILYIWAAGNPALSLPNI